MEVSGKAAKNLGHFYVPAQGSISAKISGDILHATLASGLEKQDYYIRIQNIDSIEISEAPIYALLGLGGSILLSSLGAFSSDATIGVLMLVVGVVIIVHALMKKRRLMVIYSLRGIVPMYMDKAPTEYQQFAKRIMTVARQLNAPQSVQQRPNNPTKRSQQSSLRSAM